MRADAQAEQRRARRPARRNLLVLSLAALLTWAAPGGAAAHEIGLPIAGQSLVVAESDGPDSRQLDFSALDQPAIGTDHDPASTETWLLVRGEGASGGHSGRVDLDPTIWAPTKNGYEYVDVAGTRNGVTRVRLEEGLLEIEASGADWPWIPEGEHSAVWVFFGIENETFCAQFGGSVLQNESHAFRAEQAPAPVECPVSICGNGQQELGEGCDDGNLDGGDGCTSVCEVDDCSGDAFASTFDAIRSRVFEQHGCTNGLCHGADPGQGELDLREGSAYADLLEVPAAGSSYDRIEPGKPRESALYLKLLKKVDPDTDIAGDGMPSLLPALPPALIEAMRRWIEAGAPEAGTVAGTQSLLGGCFPDPVPIEIAPLPAPDPEQGIQLVMPPYPLPPHSESEVCFATYYDVSGIVPPEHHDETGEAFYVSASETRWDPHSHHMVGLHSQLGAEHVDAPEFGEWRCIGDDAYDSALCDPLAPGSCGGGVCRSQLEHTVACIGYGPPGGQNAARRTSDLVGPRAGLPGLYRKIPLSGIVYWDSHAFNLTDSEHQMHAWRNLYYAESPQRESIPFQNLASIYIARGQAPFTRETYCSTHTFEQNTVVLTLTSHTHRRGEVFWINDPDGQKVYETFVYSDPLVKVYDPPLVFDSDDPAERTLEYCATYANGLDPEGALDLESVRRRSATPQNAPPCKPTTCTAGLVGGSCSLAAGDAACDSFLGAGDGLCDACPITAGVSTEDEMFIILGTYTVPEPTPPLLMLTAVASLSAVGAGRRRRDQGPTGPAQATGPAGLRVRRAG